jgi:hypothetical protein
MDTITARKPIAPAPSAIEIRPAFVPVTGGAALGISGSLF